MEKEINLDSRPIATGQCKRMLNSIGDALYVIGGKWKIQIIVALLDGEKRFNELQRSLNGISAKVLSSELKNMELNGLINRKVYTEDTILIEYDLTEYSRSLQNVLAILSEWGETHKEKIKESMRRNKPIDSL